MGNQQSSGSEKPPQSKRPSPRMAWPPKQETQSKQAKQKKVPKQSKKSKKKDAKQRLDDVSSFALAYQAKASVRDELKKKHWQEELCKYHSHKPHPQAGESGIEHLSKEASHLHPTQQSKQPPHSQSQQAKALPQIPQPQEAQHSNEVLRPYQLQHGENLSQAPQPTLAQESMQAEPPIPTHHPSGAHSHQDERQYSQTPQPAPGSKEAQKLKRVTAKRKLKEAFILEQDRAWQTRKAKKMRRKASKRPRLPSYSIRPANAVQPNPDCPRYEEFLNNHEPPNRHPPWPHHHEAPEPWRHHLGRDTCPTMTIRREIALKEAMRRAEMFREQMQWQQQAQQQQQMWM